MILPTFSVLRSIRWNASIVTLADKHQACPYCGFTAPKIKEYVTEMAPFGSYHTEMHNKIQGTALQMSILWKDLL